MGLFACLMGVLSCCFDSALLLRLELRNHHLSRHGITDPAAQRQQGNEEGDEQVPHEKFRCKRFLTVSFIYQSGAYRSLANMQAFG